MFIPGDERQAMGKYYMVLLGKEERVLESQQEVDGARSVNVYLTPERAQEDAEVCAGEDTYKVVMFTSRRSLYTALQPAIERGALGQVCRIHGDPDAHEVHASPAEFFKREIAKDRKVTLRGQRQAKRLSVANKGRKRSGKEIAKENLAKRQLAGDIGKGEAGVTVSGIRFQVYGKAVKGRLVLGVDWHTTSMLDIVTTVCPMEKLRADVLQDLANMLGVIVSLAHDLKRGAARIVDVEHYTGGAVTIPFASWWRVEVGDTKWDFNSEDAAITWLDDYEIDPDVRAEEWRVGIDIEKGRVCPYWVLCPNCGVMCAMGVCPVCQAAGLVVEEE